MPDDVDALKRIIAGMAQDAIHAHTLIEKLRFELARLKRAQFGTSSERLSGRIDQLELAIEALESDEAETLAAAPVVAEAIETAGAKPARRPLPAHLPREEVIHPGPCACPDCGGRLRRIGSDVTETLDYVPGRFKVVRHLREAFSCRACQSVVQAPAPHHAIARGRAGPGLLAHIVVAKFDDHLCARGRATRDVDAVRLGWRDGGGPDASRHAFAAGRDQWLGGAARRRHACPGARARNGEDQDRAPVGLRA